MTSIIGKENEEREDKSKRNYLDGIKDNFQLIKEKYGSDWIVRVYYHVKSYDKNSPVMKQLCDLACSEPNLDLCDAQKNPRNELISCFNEFWIYQSTNLFHFNFFKEMMKKVSFINFSKFRLLSYWTRESHSKAGQLKKLLSTYIRSDTMKPK